MGPTTRLTAALTAGVLAAALAAPTVDSAMATPTVPTVPDITGALTAAGVSSTNAGTILTELAALQGVTSSTPLSLGGLDSIDSTLTTLQGSLLGSLLNPVLTLEAALVPSAPTNLEGILADLTQIGSAPGATAPVQAAVTELSAALTTAGLGQLLTQITGPTPTQITSALTSLSALQSLPLGSSVTGSGLGPVSTIVSALASGATGNPQTLLNSAASALGGSTISPSTLLTAIGQIQTAGASLPSPLNTVASALANQLAASTSLFGGLASVGNAPSSANVTGALTGLTSLTHLAPGASISSSSLPDLGTILSAIAGEPGVPSSAATTLTTAGTTLQSAITPSALLTTITNLGGLSGLPAPLQSLVGQITSALGGSGTIFGPVPGLSPATVTGALTELANLPNLTGSSLPAGSLSSLGTILGQLGQQPSASGVASTLSGLSSLLTGTTPLSLGELGGLIGELQGVVTTLGAGTPLGGLVQNLVTDLGTTGVLNPGTGTGTGTTTGTGGLTASEIAYYEFLLAQLKKLQAELAAAGNHAGYVVISKLSHSGNKVSATLRCTASAGRSCSTTVTATRYGRSVHRKLSLKGGTSRKLTLKLAKAKAVAHSSKLITVAAKTGPVYSTRTVR